MRHPLGCATWISAVLLIAGLTGCASAPQYRYYTLDMRSSGSVHAAARLDTVKVTVNDALNRPEILIRTSPTQIEYYGLDRWASGLAEQLTEKLQTEFADAPADAPSIWIEAILLAFEQVDVPSGAEVRAKVDVRGGWYNDGRQVADLHKIYERTEKAASPDAAATVEALSRVVERIAVEIAQEPALQPENFRTEAGN